MTQYRIYKRIFLAFMSILFLALIHQVSSGQETRGTVQGAVTDAKSGGIPHAVVTLVNISTGVKRVAITNDSAHYIFDLVEPGSYTVSAVAPGFATTTHEDVLVQLRADVTVDQVLQVGGTQESIVVEANANKIEFNSSSVMMTLDEKLVEETPNYGRNPFLLALLDPAVVDSRADNNLPYNTWGSNSIQIAGSQNFSNDLQVDGAPIGMGLKSSFVPNTDSVQGVVVQSNAVDAEFGHSGGGIISTSLKSGTNGYHGNVFWTGRYPWMDASQDSYLHIPATTRQNMFGFNFGNPILKNKLFNFFTWENWRRTDPGNLEVTVPTEAQINGNFSASLTSNGQPLVIYDPWSTTTDNAGNVTRTPFSYNGVQNVIPPDRIDPNASKILQALNWKPNRTPDDPSGLNNWAGASPIKTNYLSYQDKVDYHFRDNLIFSGHAGRYTSPQVPENLTGSPLFQLAVPDTEGTLIGANMTYTLNPSTIFDVGGSWQSMVDQVEPSNSVPGFNWNDLFSGQSFLQNVAIPGLGLPNAPPRIEMHGNDYDTSFGSPAGYWYSHPEGHAIWGKVIKSFKNHQLKAGMDERYEYGRSTVFYGSGFAFYANSTADTYVNPNTVNSGNPYASFLTGALGDPVDPSYDWGGGSEIHQTIITQPKSNYWTYFVNDDWKVNRNLTVTLGLRYEYEKPWEDVQNRASRYLDLNATNADLAASAPQIDGATQAMIDQLTNVPQLITNGQWIFTSPSHRGMWDQNMGEFLPRVGVAYRINDKTALNIGIAYWAQPWIQQNYGPTGSFLDVIYPGYTQDQGPAPMLQGVPQVTFSNPFPASNPLVPAVGKDNGVDYGLGQSGLEYNAPNRKHTTSERMNVSIQRELPYHFVAKATYLFVPTSNIGWTYNPNMVNPALSYNSTTGPELNQQVPNPFYSIGTPSTYPGALRYSQTVPLSQLLTRFPQYESLAEDFTPGMSARYQSFGIQLQRSFHDGLSVMATYNYHYEKDQYFYDALDQYTVKWSWAPAASADYEGHATNGRHGFTETSVWEIPVGRGKRFLSSTPRALNYVIGGWEFADVLTYKSAHYPIFPAMLQVGNPTADVPRGYYFNPNAFALLPPWTRRTNQNTYSGVKGPSYFNIDATLNKNIKINERFTAKFSATAYNVLNTYVPADPNTNNVGSPTFGQSTDQGNSGRQVDLGMKVVF
jgi:hypothetical protein